LPSFSPHITLDLKDGLSDYSTASFLAWRRTLHRWPCRKAPRHPHTTPANDGRGADSSPASRAFTGCGRGRGCHLQGL